MQSVFSASIFIFARSSSALQCVNAGDRSVSMRSLMRLVSFHKRKQPCAFCKAICSVFRSGCRSLTKSNAICGSPDCQCIELPSVQFTKTPEHQNTKPQSTLNAAVFHNYLSSTISKNSLLIWRTFFIVHPSACPG